MAIVEPPDGNGRWTIHEAETEESIKLRLDAANDAQKRSRIVLLVSIVVSCMMILSAYNAYFSLQRRYMLQLLVGDGVDTLADQRGDIPIEPRILGAEAGHDLLARQYIRNWAESRNISISMLGVQVSVEDAPLLGTAALLVISIWFLLCVRRENNTIGFLLRDTQSRPSATDKKACFQRQWRVFQAIVASTLFTNFNRSLHPVRSLMGPNATTGTARWIGWIFKVVTNSLFWFPVIASFATYVADSLATNLRSPFREGLLSPRSSNPHVMEALDFSMLLLWLPMFLCLFIICAFAQAYVSATETILKEYFQHVNKHLTPPQN